jgi:hypothetical protein
VKLDLAASQPKPWPITPTLPSTMVGGYFVRILQQRATGIEHRASSVAHPAARRERQAFVVRPVSDAGLAALHMVSDFDLGCLPHATAPQQSTTPHQPTMPACQPANLPTRY